MKNFKQYLVEAVGKFMTGDVEIKGKRVKVEVEVTGVDNKQRIYHANVLAPKEHFGLELKIPAKVMHRGKWIKTKTGKAFEGQVDEDQGAANLVSLIGDETKKLIQAVHKGNWRKVKQAYSNIGKLIK